MITIEKVRSAKEKFRRSHPGVHVGISQDQTTKDYILAVRVRTDEEAAKIPATVEGVTVRCQVIGDIHRQDR